MSNAGGAEFGVIGLGVMGANLALNVEEKGFPVGGLQPQPRQDRRADGRGQGQEGHPDLLLPRVGRALGSAAAGVDHG
jgi:phosphoglycerate dehydrogenase-like enzyme